MLSERKRVWQSIQPILIFLSIAWAVHLLSTFLGVSFSNLGLYPLRASGLGGIFTSPFIHGSFNHLISNTLSLFVLASLAFYFYEDQAYPLSIWLWLTSGFWTWCFAREAYHIGASGLGYGFASFLFFSGLIERRRETMALSLLVFFLYGGMVAGLIPNDPHISWESHLSGTLAGLGFAIFYYNSDLGVKEDIHQSTNNLSAENQESIKILHIYYTPFGSDKKRKIVPRH